MKRRIFFRFDELMKNRPVDAYPHAGYAYIGKSKKRVELDKDLCTEIIYRRNKILSKQP